MSVFTSQLPYRKTFARPIDTPPASPNAVDDEFESSALDPKWTRGSSGGGTFDDATAIDPYAGFSSGHRSSLHSYRKSWYMSQPAGNAASGLFLFQTVTFPSECFLWARMSFNCRFGAQVDDDHSLGLGLAQASSGVPDFDNWAFVFLNDSQTNTVQCQGGVVNGGTPSATATGDVGTQTVGVFSRAQSAKYVGIQKLGTTYRSWMGNDNGYWLHVNSVTWAGSPTLLVLRFINASTSSPGNMIMGVDFVRMISGRMLP